MRRVSATYRLIFAIIGLAFLAIMSFVTGDSTAGIAIILIVVVIGSGYLLFRNARIRAEERRIKRVKKELGVEVQKEVQQETPVNIEAFLARRELPEDLHTAIMEIEAGNKAKGQALISDALKRDQRNEHAWLWLATTMDRIEKQRECVERALIINPNNESARKILYLLERQSHVREQEAIRAPSVGDDQSIDVPKPTTGGIIMSSLIGLIGGVLLVVLWVIVQRAETIEEWAVIVLGHLVVWCMLGIYMAYDHEEFSSKLTRILPGAVSGLISALTISFLVSFLGDPSENYLGRALNSMGGVENSQVVVFLIMQTICLYMPILSGIGYLVTFVSSMVGRALFQRGSV